MSTVIVVAANHFFDWQSRYDGVAPVVVKSTSRLATVEFDDESLKDFAGDARHYGDADAANWFGSDYLPVIRSARANVKRLDKAGVA